MKNIFISQNIKEELGIVYAEYDRGSVSVKIDRAHLNAWRTGKFYFVGDVVAPNFLYLKFTCVDFVEFLFRLMEPYYGTSKK